MGIEIVGQESCAVGGRKRMGKLSYIGFGVVK